MVTRYGRPQLQKRFGCRFRQNILSTLRVAVAECVVGYSPVGDACGCSSWRMHLVIDRMHGLQDSQVEHAVPAPADDAGGMDNEAATSAAGATLLVHMQLNRHRDCWK